MQAEPSSSDDGAAELFDFLDEYARDAERGRVRRLGEYLARYPGHEDAIAREYLRLQSGGAASEPAPDSTPAAQAQDGERRIGPYRLVRELGVGGQGAVWLCEDTRIARDVALKFMPSSVALLSADRRRRMQREAEVVSRLQHPSICPVYEAQIDHDPPYIAMRLVEGETLASAIARARNGERSGPLPLPPRNGVELRRVLLFVERAARALHAAHEAGVIHRDIKPGNVMVDRAGEPVLLDFGQARDEHAELDQRTLSGEVFGTPMYMSPEQVAGSASAIDRRTDVWSLGASLFEALTLARPFIGDSVPAVLMAIQSEPLPPVRRMNAAIEEDLAVVLETALEKDLARRYSTALEFAEDLRRVREYEPIRARSAGPLLRLRRWAQRQPALAASSALILGSLITGLVWTLHLLDREKSALQQTANALSREQEAKDDALEALEHALARQIASRSLEVLDEDPALALALGVFADQITPGLYPTRAALLPALDACRLARQLDGGVNARLIVDTELFEDSQRVAVGLDDCSLQTWDLRSGAELAFVEHPHWPLVALRAHPSGAWIATAGEDGVVRRFEASYGLLQEQFEVLREPAAALELDSSGEQLAVLGAHGALALVDPLTGAPRWRANLERADLARLCFSADGRWLAVTAARTIRSASSSSALILDADDGRVLGDLRGSDSLNDFDIASDSRAALTASQDGRVQLYSLPDCQPQGAPFEHASPVSAARFSRDGRTLLVGLDDGERSRVVLWDIATRRARELVGGHDARIVSIDVCADGRRFASTSRDTRVHTWTLEGEPLDSFNAWLQPLETRWTRDGQRLVTLGAAHYLQVWWGENSPDVYTLAGSRGAVRSVAFDSTGLRALSCGDDGVARLWSTPRAGDPRGEHAPGALLATLEEPDGAITRALFGPHDLLLTAADNGRLTWWNHDELRAKFGIASAIERGHTEQLDSAAVSIATAGGRQHGERTVTAVVTRLGSVRVFFFGTCVGSLSTTLDDEARCCALDPSGRYLAIARRDATVRVWDLHDERLAREHTWPARGSGSGAIALDIRPDGAQLVAACADARVRFFELLGARQAELDFSAFALRDVAYNADATRLLATGPNGRAAMRLIDLSRRQSDKSVRHEVYHAGNITSGAFDSTGRFVLTTSEDGSALVRDAERGERVTKFDRHGAPVLCGAFSRDDGELRVISGAANGVIRVWPVDPAPAARARQPRQIRDWEHAREERLAAPLPYRRDLAQPAR